MNIRWCVTCKPFFAKNINSQKNPFSLPSPFSTCHRINIWDQPGRMCEKSEKKEIEKNCVCSSNEFGSCLMFYFISPHNFLRLPFLQPVLVLIVLLTKWTKLVTFWHLFLSHAWHWIDWRLCSSGRAAIFPNFLFYTHPPQHMFFNIISHIFFQI